MNETKNHSRILKLCLTAVMAALVLVASDLQIQIPSVLGMNRFHLGNSMCALAGILLGPWWGGLAAGIGSALFDLTNPAYVMDAPITFLTKGAMGLMAGLAVTAGRRGEGVKPATYGRYLAAAVVTGVDALQGAPVRCTDLRGGAALVIAGLFAEGSSTVLDPGHIRRGYADLPGELRQLGAACRPAPARAPQAVQYG